jgi:hypothetical protein
MALTVALAAFASSAVSDRFASAPAAIELALTVGASLADVENVMDDV